MTDKFLGTNGIIIHFEKSTDPQNLLDYEAREAKQCEKYAKKGIMYGSAHYTDFVCTCDGLLEHFEQGLTVENALHTCAIIGYDVAGSFGYELSKAEIKESKKYQHKNGWCCSFDDCEVCNK
jgi:hypothetical protein